MSNEAAAQVSQPLVLAVDDDASILKLVRIALTEDGLRIATAASGTEAVDAVIDLRPDLMILDILLPDISGLEVMRRIRDRAPIPIVLLSAKDRDRDVIEGLEMGADDYLTKPFNPEELAARVRAVLRRTTRTARAGALLQFGDLEIDLEERLVRRGGTPIRLTRTEWNLLDTLAQNAGKVMLNAEILTKVWGPEYRDDPQYLRVWISRLRKKLEQGRSDYELIKTFPGIGYQLTSPPAAG